MALPTYNITDTMDAICKQLAAGRSLNKICQEDESMPDISVVISWLSDARAKGDPDGINAKYDRAREISADMMVDEMLDIADNTCDANLGRLRVDTRKWIASKLKPGRYGDKLEIESKQATTFNVNVIRFAPELPEDDNKIIQVNPDLVQIEDKKAPNN